MDILKKYNMFYFLCFLCVVILISEAKKTQKKTKGSHHHHHQHHGSSRIAKPRTSGTKAQQMCAKYTAQVCNEGKSSKRSKRSLSSQHSVSRMYRGHSSRNPKTIVGGRSAKSKEYPHMAQIAFGYYPGSTVYWLCGGSLISENFVLSAGHCTKDPKGKPAVRIRLGELNWASTRDDAKPVEYKILKIILHPRYDDYYLNNDIALFQFQGVKKFSEYIRPICLNVHENIPNQKLVAVGWGATDTRGRTSKDLRSVELNRVSSKFCKGTLGSRYYDRRKMLCAGYTTGGKDTCQGDSGGPLEIFNNEVRCPRMPIYTQVGITSSGPFICGLPQNAATYTKISYYIPWIESYVWR